IDATWLPALLEDRLLAPAPAELAARDWLPEARELASDHGAMWAAPQTVDGLIVVRGRGMRREDGAPATPATLDELLATAAAAMREPPGPRYGLSLRADGYWFVPFVRAANPGGVGALSASPTGRGAAPRSELDLRIDQPPAIGALERFAG